MMSWHWENPDNGRWFEARIERDIFGDLVLATRWGGQQARGMRMRTYVIPSRIELGRLLHTLTSRRRRHGYVWCRRPKAH